MIDVGDDGDVPEVHRLRSFEFSLLGLRLP